MNLSKHEIDLITLLRLCDPHDEIRIVIEDGRGGKKWKVYTKKEEVTVLSFQDAGRS
jgi:hypothetical protein